MEWSKIANRDLHFSQPKNEILAIDDFSGFPNEIRE